MGEMLSPKEGGRKQKGFYLTSVLGFIAMAGAFFGMMYAGGSKPADYVTIFQVWAIFQGFNVGGFFGFNGVEHMAKAWMNKPAK